MSNRVQTVFAEPTTMRSLAQRASIVLAMSILGCSPSAVSDRRQEVQPVMQAAPSKGMDPWIDVGVVKPKETFDHTFAVECRTAGRFERAIASCSCSSIQLHQTDHDLKAGSLITFTASIKPSSQQGDNRITFRFVTEPSDCLAPVDVIYHVRDGLYLQPSTISFGNLVENQFHEFTMRVENWGLRSIESPTIRIPELLGAAIESHRIDAPNAVYGKPLDAWLCSIRFRVPPVASSVERMHLHVARDDSEEPPLTTEIRYTSVPAIRLGPSKLSIDRNSSASREAFLMIDNGISLDELPKLSIAPTEFLEVEATTLGSHLAKLVITPSGPSSLLPDQIRVLIHVDDPIDRNIELAVLVRN